MGSMHEQRGKSNEALQRKIAVMGYPCVGKSSLTLRYVEGSFPDAYDTTIEDYHQKSMHFHNRNYLLKITDSAGQQEYSLFPRSCSVDIDGYILVYAIDDKRSFEIMQTIHDKIIDSIGDISVPLIVVGNKQDLQHNSRMVTVNEGQKLAKEWNAIFIEASAKDNTEVDKIFEKLLYEIERSKNNLLPEKKANCVVM